MFDFLNKPYDNELNAFAEHWCGPRLYETHKETLVAKYLSDNDDDGQTVEVYCTAAPARFYKIKVLEGKDSIGRALPARELITGSGEAQLAADIALAISIGMLGIH